MISQQNEKNRMSESLCRELNKTIIAHDGRYAVNKEQVFQIPALFII